MTRDGRAAQFHNLFLGFSNSPAQPPGEFLREVFNSLSSKSGLGDLFVVSARSVQNY